MSNNFRNPHSPYLIQDINNSSPKQAKKSSWLQVSIGELDARWRKNINRSTGKPTLDNRYNNASVGNDLVTPRSFTRIAPLSLAYATSVRSFAGRLKIRLGFAAFKLRRRINPIIKTATIRNAWQRLAGFAAALVATVGSASLFRNLQWRSKKYTASKGELNDWSGTAFKNVRHYGLPLAVGLFAIMLATQMWQLSTPNNAHIIKKKSAATAAAKTSTPAGNKSSNSNTAAAENTSSSTAAANGKSIPYGNSGGPTSSGTSASPNPSSGDIYSTASQTTGVPLPYTVTAPAQSIQAGGKQVLGTSPVGVTVN